MSEELLTFRVFYWVLEWFNRRFLALIICSTEPKHKLYWINLQTLHMVN